MKFHVGEIITFRPAPRSKYVTGPIAKVEVDDRGRVQYYVRLEHGPRYASCYWVWEGEAREGANQLVLPLIAEALRELEGLEG